MKKYYIVFAGVLLLVGCIGSQQGEVVEMENTQVGELKLTSPVFKDNEFIPSKYTCDGEDVNPPLNMGGVPAGTKSLALIVDDPDAPVGVWVHWVVWDINPTVAEIRENSAPGVEGITSFRITGYGGPCPPSGVHRYMFRLYALDKRLDLPESTTKNELLKAMEGHILAQTQLTGRYQRT